MRDPSSDDGDPPLAAQERFWNDWNLSRLASVELDSFQTRQQACAHAAAERTAATLVERRPLRILDFGCGYGWLGASLTPFGDVVGIDLSTAAITHGQQLFPDVQLIAGSFTEATVVGPFDLVISSDVIAHVANQAAYIERVADLLRPGGRFLLMTQNGFVWRRSSQLSPQGRGQIRNWPSLSLIRRLLKANDLDVERVESIEPAGDRGVLRVLNSRLLRGGFKLVGLGLAWKGFLERLRTGRDLTIEARRA